MLIHIGYQKCGSTWLQKNLFDRADRGFFAVAPEGMKSQQSKHLAQWFIRDAEGHLIDPFSSRKLEIQELYAKFLPRAGNQVPVISAERLAGQAFGGGYDSVTLANRIKDAFPDAKILITIREQVAVILSLYFHYLRAGGHRHYKHFLSPNDGVLPKFAPSFYEYDKLISYYHELFGAENVLCLPFEQLVIEPEQFIESLRTFSGADIPDDLPFKKTEKEGLCRTVELRTRYLNLFKKTRSINGYAIETPQCVEKAIVGLRRHLSRIVSKEREAATVTRVKSDIGALLESRYSDSNMRTESLVGLPLRTRFGYQ